MGPWMIWLWRLLRNKRFRAWLLATAGPRAIALFLVWLERVRHRQVAIGEADQVDGMFSAAIIDGNRHVVVWKDDRPVSAYPPVEGDLAAKLAMHARRDLRRPGDLPTRRARRLVTTVVGRARGGAERVVHGVHDGADAVRRLAPGGSHGEDAGTSASGSTGAAPGRGAAGGQRDSAGAR